MNIINADSKRPGRDHATSRWDDLAGRHARLGPRPLRAIQYTNLATTIRRFACSSRTRRPKYPFQNVLRAFDVDPEI